MKRSTSPFKWHHHTPDVILLCVRRYCRYSLSYRDLEGMMRERGLAVDHVTISDCVKTQRDVYQPYGSHIAPLRRPPFDPAAVLTLFM